VNTNFLIKSFGLSFNRKIEPKFIDYEADSLTTRPCTSY